jgi:hypothetical protein
MLWVGQRLVDVTRFGQLLIGVCVMMNTSQDPSLQEFRNSAELPDDLHDTYVCDKYETNDRPTVLEVEARQGKSERQCA